MEERGKRYIYLVRHGQYHMDREQEGYGTLTALGRRQAHSVGRRLAREHEVEFIHHSDMPRAIETAEIVAGHLSDIPKKQSRLLREGLPTAPSHWNGRPSRAHLARTRERMDAAYGRYFKPLKGKKDRHDLIVAHGNLIRYLVRRALGDPIGKWWRMDILQCSLCVVAIVPPPRHSVLMAFNDVGHLTMSMRTRL